MKRSLPAILVALVIATCSQAYSPRVRLRYTLREGKTIAYRIRTETKAVQTVKGHPVQRVDRREIAVEWRLGEGNGRARQVRVMLAGCTGTAETSFGADVFPYPPAEEKTDLIEEAGPVDGTACTLNMDNSGRLREIRAILDEVTDRIKENMAKSASGSSVGNEETRMGAESVRIFDASGSLGNRNFYLAMVYLVPSYKRGSVRAGEVWRTESFFSDSIYRGEGQGQSRLAGVAAESYRVLTEAEVGYQDRIEGGFIRKVTPEGRFELRFAVEIQLAGTLQAEYFVDRRDCWPRRGRIITRLTGWTERLGLRIPVTVESVVSYERLAEEEGGLAS